MPTVTSHAAAADALEDSFTLQGLRARQPRGPDGGFDWRWTGPNRDPEWAWFFNRHGWFPDLWHAWETTADPRYRDALFTTLGDWIAANPPPRHFSFSHAWRPLEAARRLLGSWLPLRGAILEDPAAGSVLTTQFQASLQDHGRHLRAHHALGGNHLVTEMLALVRLALSLPGHPPAPDWLAYGLDRLDRSYREQVYPDGAYKELSSHYQRIVTLNYQQLLDTLREARRDDLTAAWTPRVERLWAYVRDVTTPAGFNPLNNDSDREPYARLLRSQAPALAERPPCHAVHFAWAGQTVFRDTANRLWGFFDAGPRGTDHDHADFLSFTLALGTREFLVDNGRHTYAPGPWRDYFAGPAAHNILLLDHRACDQGPRAVSSAPRRATFQRASRHTLAWGDGVFALDGNPRAADWRRIVVHLDDLGWIVLDRVVTFAPHRLSTQWHWHPGCALPADPDPAGGLRIRHAESRLRLRLLTNASRGLAELAVGRTLPAPQGWFSARFNHREPAPALLHHQDVTGTVINAWLFQPGDAPEIRAALLQDGRLRLAFENEASFILDPAQPELRPCPGSEPEPVPASATAK
ncbi:MAG: heparinase [Rariglobus sp.]|nr:heparinase [Rariglobus sp.]